MKPMKTKKVKYDAIKLAIIKKNYDVNNAIKTMVRDLPHFEFEDLRMKLTDEIIDLKLLKREGTN